MVDSTVPPGLGHRCRRYFDRACLFLVYFPRSSQEAPGMGAWACRHALGHSARREVSMKRSIVVVVACLGVLIGASSAQAAVKVEQWNTPGGQFVNRKDEFPRDLVNGHLV